MMTTAPNSLIPLAHISIIPDAMPLHAIGSETVKNALDGEAPNVLAAFSSFGSTASNAWRAALIKNGIETKAIAMDIPAEVPTRPSPKMRPIAEFLLITAKSAIPAAECGMIIGRSIIALTIDLALNRFFARI